MSNGDPAPPSRVEQFNSAIRGAVTLILCLGFVAGFLLLKLIDTQVYAQIFGMVVAFWFASRGQSSPPPPTPPPATPEPAKGVTP